jgi:lysozyme
MDTALMIAELKRDEGLRLTVYDDATGLALKPGVTLKGHPTIGVGRALDIRGISTAEAIAMLTDDITAFETGLRQAYVWYGNLDDVRQRVLLNMAFNLGLAGLSQFRGMLNYVAERNYDGAAREMEESAWYRQAGARAKRLAEAMSSGVVQ